MYAALFWMVAAVLTAALGVMAVIELLAAIREWRAARRSWKR